MPSYISLRVYIGVWPLSMSRVSLYLSLSFLSQIPNFSDLEKLALTMDGFPSGFLQSPQGFTRRKLWLNS
jgi:hypothetical protein